MKIFFSVVISLSVFTAQGQAIWTNTAFVKRANQTIVDSRNEPIKLKTSANMGFCNIGA